MRDEPVRTSAWEAIREAVMNFRGRVCEIKIFFFFCILVLVDGVNVEISMNPNDQCRLCTFVFLIRLKGRTTRVNEDLKF